MQPSAVSPERDQESKWYRAILEINVVPSIRAGLWPLLPSLTVGLLRRGDGSSQDFGPEIAAATLRL